MFELEPSRVNIGRKGTAARVAGSVGWIATIAASSLIFSGSAVGVIAGFSTSSMFLEELLLASHVHLQEVAESIQGNGTLACVEK